MLEGYSIVQGKLCQSDTLEASVWLCTQPDTYEREELKKDFGISAQMLESSLDPDEVARVEFRQDLLFLVWKRAKQFDGRGFDVSSFGAVLSAERLVVICGRDAQLLASLDDEHYMETPLEVLMALLSESVRHYLDHLRVVKLVARELQQQFSRSLDNEHLLQLFNLSESLVYYVNAIQSNGSVLSLLRNQAEKQQYSSANLKKIDELILENDQSYKQAKLYSTVFAGLIEARGNLANINMNKTLRKLTLINVVFLPLNLIASIGGMSEFSMMTAGVPWWYSFPLLILGMAGIGAITVLALKPIARMPTLPPPPRNG